VHKEENMTDEIKPIQTWAVVELMGHVKSAGLVSEENHFGTVMLRLDIPEVGDKPARTEFYGGSAIYRVTPCTEEVARLVLQQSFQAPIVAYQLPRPRRETFEPDVAEPVDGVDVDRDYDEEDGEEDNLF
jgi:hypothetical protein